MNSDPKPVRAWAETDKWTMYWQLVDSRESMWLMPKDGASSAWSAFGPLLEMVQRQESAGEALRGLRVLFDTGHELRKSMEAYVQDNHWWSLRLHGKQVEGWWDGNETEAVERAIEAAVAWIGAQGR